MIDQLKLLATRLRDAEYLHVFLETFPLYGILFGTLFFVLAFVLKDAKIQMAGLGVIFVAALMSWPQLKNRSLAEPHMKEVRSAEYGKRIEEQTLRRSSVQWAYFVLAVGCVLTFVTKKSKAGPLVLGLTVAGAGACVLLSAWLHMKEAEILHPNINLGPGVDVKVLPKGRL